MWRAYVISCAILLSSGCSHYYARRVLDPRIGRARAYYVQELECASADDLTVKAVLVALADEDRAIRFFALRSAGALYAMADRENRARLVSAIIENLDIAECGSYCEQRLPLLPVGYCGATASVRAMALLTLTSMSQRDFGFDRSRWRIHFGLGQEKTRYRESSVGQEKTCYGKSRSMQKLEVWRP